MWQAPCVPEPVCQSMMQILEVGVSKTLDATRPDPAKNQGGIAIVQLAVENHPQDSRVKINEDGVVQTLSGQMGTGGGMFL